MSDERKYNVMGPVSGDPLHALREDAEPWSTPRCGTDIGPWFIKAVTAAEWDARGCETCKQRWRPGE